ncbi:Uncharacterised protein [Salmonella enterica subsp. arizonae]|uniref:Uncharacterized protein n=1 Tax=Salmonella enterica subsp. arizonae TaxID=59203 RepID=A0A2X4TDI6_SALER|nr:Uncharacterised protein [Salmonella enterica subsp. arizonae]
MQSQSILHVRRYEYHRADMSFGYLRHQSGAGGAGKLAQLALIASFCRQRVTLFFRHNGCLYLFLFYAALYASSFRLLHGWLCAGAV